MSFKNLKDSSSSFDLLNSELQKVSSPQGGGVQDERFWKPEVDKAGNGYAIIRFLPAAEGESVPFVRYYNHAFQGPGGAWYIENCLTTIGKDDPVTESNSVLWNTNIESNKALARERKRNTNYVSNIYVVEDPSNPENNGKVFLFRYGKKIFDKINDAIKPKFADQIKMNPFDIFKGANFRLRISKVDGYRSYQDSIFDPVAPLHPDEAVMEAIYNQEYPLQPFIAADQFKDYDVLKAKFLRVINSVADDNKPLGEDFATPKFNREAAPSVGTVAAPVSSPTLGEDNKSSLDYFQKLVEKA